MRTRVDAFERIIKMAQRDKDGPKNWKETHGGILEEDRELKEEKKVEEVFVMKKWLKTIDRQLVYLWDKQMKKKWISHIYS